MGRGDEKQKVDRRNVTGLGKLYICTPVMHEAALVVAVNRWVLYVMKNWKYVWHMAHDPVITHCA